MSLCFSIGVQGRNPSSQLASGIHLVEHVKYQIRRKETDNIQLFTDLFLPNISYKEQTFSIMHIGDISFETTCADEVLSRNNFQTYFIEKAYAPSLKGQLERKKGLICNMSPCEILPIDIKDAEKYRVTFLRKVGGTGDTAPFTLYNVRIPGRTYGYIRTSGIVQGKMLDRLTDNKKRFDIYGGEILLNEIKKYIHKQPKSLSSVDLDGHLNDYESIFDGFVKNEYVEPERYDIVIRSSPETKLTRVNRLSSDLTYGCEGGVFNGEEIYWYWSRSARFHTLSHINGLRVCVELGV